MRTPREPHPFADDWWLFEELGRGGMGAVWLARRRHGFSSLARSSAIKRIHPRYAAHPAMRLMFLDEVALASRVVHPNVASVTDFGEHEDELWCAMDFVDGVDLGTLLRELEGSPREWPVLARVFVDVALGLAAAHRAMGDDGEPLELVHRDVSFSNLLVGWDGYTRICDFGVASARQRFQAKTVGAFKGKARYASPEQLDGEPLGPESDLWALGVVMWEALTRRRLFAGKSQAELIQQVARGPIAGVREVRPDLPAAFDEIVSGCLVRDRARRSSDAAAVGRALGEMAILDGRAVCADHVAELASQRCARQAAEARQRHLSIQRFLRDQDQTLSTPRDPFGDDPT